MEWQHSLELLRPAVLRNDLPGSLMLKIEGLTKSFGGLVAVDNVTFEVPAGQMVGIIGRSGAGKSTLLRMINRLTDASSGRILCDDVFGGEVDVCTLKGRRVREWR